jgi:hypothetical protein
MCRSAISAVKNWKASVQKRVKAIPISGPITTVDITQKPRTGMIHPEDYTGKILDIDGVVNWIITSVADAPVVIGGPSVFLHNLNLFFGR